jgi:hypothetical protein
MARETRCLKVGGVDTSFGTVTSKRIIYFTKRGWLAGGAREDIPLRHVTSIRLETSRVAPWGSPKVVLNTAGGDLRPARGLPWTRPEANRFVKSCVSAEVQLLPGAEHESGLTVGATAVPAYFPPADRLL